MIIPFIPARDFELSKQFYEHIGFNLGQDFSDGTTFVECSLLDNFFILQDLYIKEWAENTMFIVEVKSLEDTLELATEFSREFPAANVKVKGPFEGNYGRQLHITDPSGVLWHVFKHKEKEVE